MRNRRVLVVVLALGWLSSAPALAARPPVLTAGPPADAPPPTAAERMLGALGVPDCKCKIDVVELQRYRDLVAAAASAEDARALATRPSSLARRALDAARWLAPWSRSLHDAHLKLIGYEGRVAEAKTPADAAREFEGLVQLASNGVNVSGNSGHCHYDTAEIVAIVFGFLLFIIPGIILLIVFC